MMDAHPLLFSEYMFHGMKLCNRFVQTPIQTRAADADGHASRELLDWHESCAEDPAPGIVIVQQAYAWPAVRPARGLALWDDSFIEPLAGLVDILHRKGSRVFLQLGGTGSRLEGNDVAPSPVAGSWDGKVPREMTREEMRHYRDCYAEAGSRLFRAGFDGFSLQGSGGKFLAQFLSPHSNRRTDEYGGSARNRVRYFLEVMDAIRQKSSASFPMIMRYDASDFMEGGHSPEIAVEQAGLLIEGGVSALLMGGGGQERLKYGVPSWMIPPVPLFDLARVYKRHFPDTPVILGGKAHTPELAEHILQSGAADLAAVIRPLLADHAYLRKIREGRFSDVRRCVCCLNCQTWSRRPALKERPILCTVNPAAFSEGKAAAPASSPRNIMVAGGGLAGMEAALEAARRGHRVSLHEKNSELGGQWRIAGMPQHHEDYRTLVPSLRRALEAAGVDIHLEEAVTRELAERLRPDDIIVATGALPRSLGREYLLPSAMPVIQGVDVLQGRLPRAERVVVIGGRYIGMEAACLLAEAGKNVSLIEMNDIGQGTISRLRSGLFDKLVRLDVRLYPHSALFRVTSDCVEVRHGGGLFLLPAGAVVTAIGTVPERKLLEALEGGPWHIHAVGDCSGIGDAMDAMYSGWLIGTTV